MPKVELFIVLSQAQLPECTCNSTISLGTKSRPMFRFKLWPLNPQTEPQSLQHPLVTKLGGS